MADYLPPVVARLEFDIGGFLAKVEEAKAAIKSLGATSADVNVKYDVNAAQLAKVAALTDAATAATGRGTAGIRAWGLTWTQWLKVIHNGLLLFGANIAADAVGIGVFALAAAKYLGPVFSSLDTLGSSYASLDNYQKAAAVSLHQFLLQFQGRGEQGIFTTFTMGLNAVKSAAASLGGGILKQATQAVQSFIGMLTQSFKSPGWQELFGHTGSVVNTDMTALFSTITSLLNLIPVLTHDFNFLGLGFLSGVRGIATFISWLGQSNPTLTRFIFLGISAMHAWQWLSGSRFVSGIGRFASDLGKGEQATGRFGKAISALSSGAGISAAVEALTGVGVATLGIGLAAGAAAVGIGILIYESKNWKDATGQLVDKLTAADHATGYNTAGYLKLSNQLGGYAAQADKAAAATGRMVNAGRAGSFATGAQHTFQELTVAQKAAAQQATVLAGNFNMLSTRFGYNRQQAIAAANAMGINLKSSITGSSTAAQIAQARFRAFAQTTQGAVSPISQLDLNMRMLKQDVGDTVAEATDLTNAFAAMFDPLNQTLQTTAQLKLDQLALAAALKASNGQVGTQNGLAAQAQLALVKVARDAEAVANAVQHGKVSYQQAAGVIQQQINYLKRLGNQSAAVRSEIRALQAMLNGLHSKSITITTFMRTISTGGVVSGGGGHTSPIGGAGGRPALSFAGLGGSTSAPVQVTHVHVQSPDVHIDGKKVFSSVRKQASWKQKLGGRNAFQKPIR